MVVLQRGKRWRKRSGRKMWVPTTHRSKTECDWRWKGQGSPRPKHHCHENPMEPLLPSTTIPTIIPTTLFRVVEVVVVDGERDCIDPLSMHRISFEKNCHRAGRETTVRVDTVLLIVILVVVLLLLLL